MGGEIQGFLGIENGVSPLFACPFKIDLEIGSLAEDVKEVHFVRSGVVEQPKDLHRALLSHGRL